MFDLRRSVPTLLIAAVVIVMAGSAVISSWLFRGMTDAVEEGQFATIETIVTVSLRSAEDRALARAQLIADLPSTKAGFAGHDQAARDRLLAEYTRMFEVQRDKYGVDQMQFHVPPAVSFLRLQAPTQHGDDLSEFRPLVVAVNRDQVARKGPAIARSGPAMFGAVPVYDPANRHLGSFEVGIEFDGVLDDLKVDHGLESALLIAEDPLRRFGAPDVTAPLLNEANRVGKYIKTHSTHWELMQQVVSSSDVAVVDGPKRYTQSANGTPYGVVLVPVRNFGGDPMGVVAVARDFGVSQGAAGRSMVLQALLALFGIVALAGVILVVVRGMLLEPLAELRTLAARPAIVPTDVDRAA